MKKYFATALLLACALAIAEGQATRLIQPKGTASELRLAELKSKDGLIAKFRGQTWLSGTFVVRWPAGPSATADKTAEYMLVPDPVSVSKLPHFVISDPTYKNSYRVRDIEIQNGEEALRLAFTDATAKNLFDRKTDSIRVTGRFLIDSYEVGVECDAPWARAMLVKVNLPDQLAVVHRKVQERC